MEGAIGVDASISLTWLEEEEVLEGLRLTKTRLIAEMGFLPEEDEDSGLNSDDGPRLNLPVALF